MKRLLILPLLLIAAYAIALDIPPPPTQWVTDRAGILNSQQLESLNAKLRAFEERSGAQFIIYTLPSLEGESPEDFSIRAAERWKVGQKKYDNGLILFVFLKDRTTRVEVGRGLEQTVTDLMSGRVVDNTIPPFFQRGDYAGGLNAAADQFIALIERNEAPVPVQRPSQPGSQQWSISDILFALFILFIILTILGPMFRRGGCGGCCLPMFWGGGGTTFGGGGFGGGGFGGGGGGFGGFSGGGGSFGGGGATGRW